MLQVPLLPSRVVSVVGKVFMALVATLLVLLFFTGRPNIC